MEIRGENLFSGYWPDGSGGPDADGWFATGDVAYADDAGDYRIVDRARELIIVNGFNVYPREIELVLAGAPGVAEAAVIGIADEATGEAVKGFLTAMPGAEIDLDAVRQHCEEWLARFKQPRELVVVDRLPHSPTGKVAKRMLRAT
jgi:long-chain acyl-CoA synthetase